MPDAVAARCARTLAGVLVLGLAALAFGDRGGPPSPPAGPPPSQGPPVLGGVDVDTDRPEREPSSAGTPSAPRQGADPVVRGPARPFTAWRAWWQHARRGLPVASAAPVDDESSGLLASEVRDRLLDAVDRCGADAAVRATAMTALARLGDDSDAVCNVLYAPLRDSAPVTDDAVAAAAAFAAVRLEDRRPSTRRLLLRRVAGHRHDLSRLPAYAALALGLLGETDRGAVTDVLLLTATAPKARRDVRAAAALALGLLGDPAALAPLAAVTGSGAADDDDLCARIHALGRLGAVGRSEAALAALEPLLDDAESGRARGAAALALAHVLPSLEMAAQRRVGGRLRTVATKDADGSARSAALLALGRAAGDERTDAVTRERSRALLEHVLRRTRGDPEIRCFAALGLSVAASGTERDAALFALGDVAERTRTDELLGAIAVGRATSRDPRVARRAAALVAADQTPAQLRADMLAALGLLCDPAHGELVLLHLLRTSSAAAADACGRLGVVDAAAILLAAVSRADRAFHARSLGRVAGATEVRRLLRLLGSGESVELPAATRAMAALGHVRRRGADPVDRLAAAAAAGAAIPAVLDALARP